MRRRTVTAVRLLLVLALAAAIFDLPLPGRARGRVRIHLIDRSGSVLVPGPAESITPDEARRIAAWDAESARPGDTVDWAAFGKDFATRSSAVDPEESRLESALESALARNPTEIVLYTDGRADPGRAAFLCRARGVPVHVVPLGPVAVRDARISRVSAPATAAAGEPVTVEATIEATFSGTVRVRSDDVTREVSVAPGAPVLVPFGGRGAGPFSIRLEADGDACPQNNVAAGEVFERSDRRRVLVLSEAFPPLSGFDAKVSSRFESPHGYDAVILDNVTLSPEAQRTLASYVRDFGGGLLLLGGRNSYDLGKWSGTPIEDVSPLRARPDRKVAVVFVIDGSGSMKEGRLDAVVAAVRDAWRRFDPVDLVRVLTFPKLEFIDDPDRLFTLSAQGPTNIAGAVHQAILHLQQAEAGRKQIFLMTDGVRSEDEKPEALIAQKELLERGGIKLTVVTTDRELEVGDQVKIDDWKALGRQLDRLLPDVREVYREKPGRAEFLEHPATAGIGALELPAMNVTTAKAGAQVVAAVGRPPAPVPAAAFWRHGRGVVGAFAFEVRVPRLLEQSLGFVAGEAEGILTLSVDPPVVRARGSGPAQIAVEYQARPSLEAGTLLLEKVRADVWEAPLPATKPGTVIFRHGRARAAATVPSLEEYRELGVDRAALGRIAGATGGRVLASTGDLAALPRPSGREARPGRPAFLVAGLALLFLEMALSTFWKP
jgi:uncharacterized membrane protein